MRRQNGRGGLGRARVAVLLGGTSDEREVSLRTGEEVLAALRGPGAPGAPGAPGGAGGARDARGPAEVLRLEIAADGAWVLEDADPAPPAAALATLAERVDACFLALHGGEGEDGHVQAVLELVGLAHTGSDARASTLCMDKWAARLFVERAGLRTAPAVLLARDEWEARAGELGALLAAAEAGACVKPRAGGSSVGTARARGPHELEVLAQAVLEAGEEVLVEAWTEGVELTCAVLGNRATGLRALPVVEIRPSEGRFFDYEEKYSDEGARELCPPESVGPEVCARVVELALRAHRELGCDGYSRTDFIFPHDGSTEPVYLETNSLPGLTQRSLVPLAAAAEGTGFRSLCLEILALGLERGRA